MISAFYRKLQIREDESKLFGLLALHALCFGATFSFSYTAAASIFFAHFDETAWLWSYVLVAAVGIVASVILAFMQRRLSTKRLLNSVTLFLLVSGIVFWAGLQFMPSVAFLFGVAVWEQMQYTLSEFEWFGIQGEVLTIQQGKRLLGAVGGVEEIAKIGTYIIIPLLLPIVAVHNLLLIAIVLYIVQLGVMQRIFKLQKDVLANAEVVPTKEAAPVPFQALLRRPYVLAIFGFTALLIIFEMTLAVGFFSSIQLQFKTEAEIARFLSYFSLILYGCLFVFRSFIATRLLQRFGAEIGFLALPVSITVASVASLIVGEMIGVASIAFLALIAVTQAAYEVTGTGLQEASQMLVWQVVKSDTRIQAQNLLQTLVIPLAIGLTGAFFLIFSPDGAVSLRFILLTMVVLALGMWVFGRYVIRNYHLDLPKRFSSRLFSSGTKANLQSTSAEIEPLPILHVDNTTTLAALRETLNSGQPQEVEVALAVLNLISSALPSQADLALVQQNANPQIRAVAEDYLTKLSALSVPNTETVLNAAQLQAQLTSQNIQIKLKALQQVGALKAADYQYYLFSALRNPRLASTAVTALAKLDKAIFAQSKQLLEDLTCPTYIKHYLVQALAMTDNPDMLQYLHHLLPTSDVEARHHIIKLIERKGHRFWHVDEAMLVDQFSKALQRGRFLSAMLVAMPPEAVVLTKALTEAVDEVRLELMRLLNCLHPTDQTRRATYTLEKGDADAISLALEYLGSRIAFKQRTVFRVLLNDSLTAQQRWQRLQAEHTEPEFSFVQALVALLQAPTVDTSRWLRAATLYTASQYQVPELVNAIVAGQYLNDPLLKETAQTGLRQLGLERAVLGAS